MKKLLLCLSVVVLAATLAIGAFAAETVIYENDFSDPSTLRDFKQYRMVWEIKDGGLYLTDEFTTSNGASVDTSFAHIIYQAKETYKDYILEVDYMNVQTAGGIIFRADQNAVTDAQNGFRGYVAFVANNANCAALGSADNADGWKGNINVGKTGNMNISSNVHIKVTVKGEKIHVLVTNIDNGKTVYDYTYITGTSDGDFGWEDGTFGLRMRAGMKANDAYSAGNAYFDNFKVTTANEVNIAGGSAGTTTPQANPSVTIDTSNLVKVYENNFDSAKDIADFVQYRGTWAVYGGQLYLSAGSEGAQSYILYAGDAKLTELVDYVVDVDMLNTQTQGGVIMRSDLYNVTGTTDDGFMGYMGFISNDGTLGAIGAGKADGKWLDGNIEVSKACLKTGSNIHLQMAVKGDLVQLTITDKASGKVLWTWCEKNDLWTKGTFGFRLRSKATNAGLNNLNTTSFDNLVISTFADGASAAKTEVKLTIGSKTAYVNGKAETLDAAPINRNNRTLLPVRFLANTFGVPNEGIKWDAATRTATLTNSEVTIVVKIDAPSMTVNGKTVALDSPAIIENNRTYLPVRAIANALGVSNDNIKWDAATSTATLVK
ncbi:MAG: hypothetical protein IJC81_03365 [Clostridia bacterium]|nr:hypothetical protein [Clostridia bacterium]